MRVGNADIRTFDVTRGLTNVSDAYAVVSGLTGQFAGGGQTFADGFAGTVAAVHGATAVCQGIAWLGALDHDTDYSAGRHFINALGDAAACVGYGMAAAGGGTAPLLFGAAGTIIANVAQFACG